MLDYIRKKIEHLGRTCKKLRGKRSYGQYGTILLIIIIVGGVFAYQHEALAVTEDVGTAVGNGIIWAISKIQLFLAQLAMAMVTFLLRFFIELAGYNGFIDAPPVEVGWLMVRDVANMFFVIMLLVIAFGTILGLEQYEWKKTLGKLLLAAILINFSKLILQLIIDIAHVFTTTFLNAIAATSGGNLIRMFKMDSILNMTGGRDLSPGNLGSQDIRLDIFIGSTMAVIMAVMAMVTIGAYLVMMVARVMVLWILMAFSPFAFLMQAIPATKSYAEEFWKEFTHHVIVAPLMVFFLWLSFATIGSGNIAQDVGLQLSKVGDAGASAAVQAGLPTNPAVATNDASSWDNLASFVIALGFLWIGVMMVQRLGVKGGGALSSALDFGKKVATIATGYAAGRYLVKRGAAGVADTAKDYGTILASRTGLNKLPLIGSQRASLIRRKAAVGKQEAYDAARKREIEARTGLGEGGIAGSLITGGEKRVKQDIKAKAAEQRNAEETKELESKIKEQDYTNFEQAVAKHEQSTGNKATLEVKAQIAAGQGLGLAAAAVAADRAKIATTSAEGKEKAVVSGLSLEDTLQQGRQFKENLDHERSELLVDKSFDEQRDTKIKRVDRDLSSGRLSAADAEERKASLRQQYAEAKSDTTKREARKRALDRLPTEKYAALAGKLTNKEIAGAEQRAYAGLDRVRALSQEQKGKQKEGKLTSETERISGVVGDILRAEEGKGRTLVRQREEAKAREEIKELGESHDNSEVLTEISDRHKVIQRLNAKSKTSAGLDAGEKKQLEKATQEQKGFLASALHRGLGNYVGGIIKANDSTYNDIEFSDPENAHLIALAATSGEKHTELDSVEKASKVERVVDKRAKEKAGILNRAIKQGAAEAASKHGQFQFASYSREGVDASGQKVVGLTALQRSGLGKSLAGGTTQLGTGKTGDGSKGREIIEDFIESVIEPNLTIDTSRDARTFFKSKVDASSGEEVFSGAATPASRNAILSLADKSADQIAKMPGSVLNVLSGGTEKKSGFDGSKFVFKDSTQKALFKDVLDKFQKNINDATGPAAKDRSRKGLQKALNLLGVDDATISSYGVGISNIESLPLNRLVP